MGSLICKMAFSTKKTVKILALPPLGVAIVPHILVVPVAVQGVVVVTMLMTAMAGLMGLVIREVDLVVEVISCALLGQGLSPCTVCLLLEKIIGVAIFIFLL